MVKLEEKKSRLTTTSFGAASLQYSLFARESRSTKNHIHRGEHKRYRERNESNRIYAYIQRLALWFNVCLSVDVCVCVNVWNLWYRTVRFHCIQHAYCTKYIINDAKMFSAQCTCVLTYLCSSSIAFAMWWLFMFGLFHRFDASASRASAIKYNSLNHTDASGRIKLNDGRTAERRMQTEMSANSKNIVWGRERNPSNVKRFNNNIDKKVNANTLNTW